MYLVVPSESMSLSRSVSPVVWRVSFILLVLLFVAGCSSKRTTPSPSFTLSQQDQTTTTPYLPSDDGVTLSAAEQKAWASVGTVDRNLSPEDTRDALLHFKLLVHKDRYTVEKNLERCRLYLPYIFQTLRANNLPEELAYIPFVESGYSPVAVSKSGAVGMWQFMPSTGQQYGMAQDWWMDERRDPYQATQAAAEYFKKLYDMFGDWPLAITAYNAGEGRVSRGLAASRSKTFFELRQRETSIYSSRDRLSEESRQYFPKFLAVCKIMRNLELLGFQPLDKGAPVSVTRLTVRPGTDLKKVAAGSGLSWDKFFVNNPAYLRPVSHPGRFSCIYVPRHMSNDTQKLLMQPSIVQSGWRTYTTGKGETLPRIASKTGIPVAELRRINQVREPLRAGVQLKVPDLGQRFTDGSAALVETERKTREVSSRRETSLSRDTLPRRESQSSRSELQERTRKETIGRDSTVSGRTLPATHTVRPGETMYSLSRQYGVGLEQLMAANNMTSPTMREGQALKIPSSGRVSSGGSSSSRVPSPRQEPAASMEGPVAPGQRPKTSSPAPSSEKKNDVYTVQPGDTVWAIARKFEIDPMALLARNNLTRESRLQPGDRVVVRK